ncbi:membrane-spanning 4-domains subfamily A member 8-like [Erythrolamprus reginae]|uniref:membrane-spanning 4-domains subfamily A member 8-like n=1 Tax=Erythrolamprus reginae TaxID=121349 RepID=UPI00396CFB8D
MASGTIIVISPNGGNMIQTVPGFPGVPLQAPGAIPYPQYGAQQLGIPTNAPQQVPKNGPLERFYKAEPKVLGAIQIIIGLLHIGFGAVSLCLHPFRSLNLSGIGGYPFWGGIFFISSGSLCVSAANSPNRRLVKSSVGMNITSAVMALIGIILYICELSLRSDYFWFQYDFENETVDGQSAWSVSYGLSSVLLLFSMLEFCIAVPLAHFGCQATCCSDDQPTVLSVPYQVIVDAEVAAGPNPPPPPPTYDNVISKSQ